MSREQREIAKKLFRVKHANCETCRFYSEASYDYYAGEYDAPECGKYPCYPNLKSFPFKKEMECWRPDFFATQLVFEMDATDESIEKTTQKFWRIVEEIWPDEEQESGDE